MDIGFTFLPNSLGKIIPTHWLARKMETEKSFLNCLSLNDSLGGIFAYAGTDKMGCSLPWTTSQWARYQEELK